MKSFGHWMESWERSLTLRDRNRQIFPFSWGLDWIQRDESESDPLEEVRQWARLKMEKSDQFFAAPEMKDPRLNENRLTFETPLPGKHVNNNRVSCRIFPAQSTDRAVVVVPQWNADSGSHVGLCRLLSRLGMTAVRLTLPFHEERSPNGMKRADYMVSPNIGRTLSATRQAVLEVNQVVGWLKGQGYSHVGVLGTSLGSCVSYLAFVHDRNIETAVFNHVSSYFADVVWTGLSTRYVRWGLEGHIKLEDLRDCWAPLSPWYFIDKLQDDFRHHLMITAKYDLTFLPELSDLVFRRYRQLGLRYEHIELPCGHYSTARLPFSVMDAWYICRFLRAHLGVNDSF